MQKALITGIAGQDGSYLAELLLNKDYKVYGLEKELLNERLVNLKSIQKSIKLLSADLANQDLLLRIIKKINPDEIYNLAGLGFVKESWDRPEYAAEVNAFGVLRILEVIKEINPKIKFFQASSAEMFGLPQEVPQNEKTPFLPVSSYGVAKLYGHWITASYREKYNIFACSGILYNHESPRRSPQFVTRKISDGAARIKLGLSDKLVLGNLDAKRDWGYAPEYVEAMQLMLQQDKPDDYIIATGQVHSVKEFVQQAFRLLDLDWKKYIVVDKQLKRPSETRQLVGNSNKAREKMGWQSKTDFNGLVKIMVESDLKNLSRQL